MSGRLVLVIGPSGVGKDTLIEAARQHFVGDDSFVFPQRIISRPGTASENNEFVDADVIDRLAKEDAYALHWRAHGHSYAISPRIEADLALGRIVICNISRAVVARARKKYPTFVIQIAASPEILEARLAARNRDSDGDIKDRIARANAINCSPDAIIRNETALEDVARAFCELIASD
jgi:ribose 1,5-bisphosphokinase